MKKIFALAVLILSISISLDAQEVDREKLKELHQAGKALQEALANPASTPAQARELCRRVDIEAQKVEHGITSKEEKYIYDLYSTASAEYQASLQRFEKHRSQTRLDVDLMPVKEYLRIADDTFNGRPVEVRSAPPPPPPAPAPNAAPPEPAPPAAPPAHRVEPPPPPTEAVAPPPAPAAEIPPAPPATLAPAPSPIHPAPPEAAPPAPEPVAAAPPPPVPAAPPVAAPAPSFPPLPVSRPQSRSIVGANPTTIRKAADRVRVEKKEDAVRPCDLVIEVSVPGKSVSGVWEFEGHNFYYGSGLELARFKTVEAGGDTMLVKSSSKTELTALAYRCGEAR